MGWFEAAVTTTVSVVGSFGDAIEDLGGAVADTTEDIVDGAASITGRFADAVDQTIEGNPITPIVGGLVVGFMDMVRDNVAGLADLVRDVTDFLGAVLKLDLVGALLAIVSFAGHVVQQFFILLRSWTLGYFVGGIVKQFSKAGLRSFVNGLIGDQFDAATAVRVRQNVGLTGGGPFGFRLAANDVVMRIDSAGFPDLAGLHKSGALDLYRMSGRSNDGGRLWEIWPRPRSEGYFVDIAGVERRVTSLDISRFLDSDGRVGRLRFYAATPQAQQQKKRMATRLHEQLGVNIAWKGEDNFSWWRNATRDVVDITAPDEYDFDVSEPDTRGMTWLVDKGLKRGGGVDVCELVTVSSFNLVGGYFGVTIGQGGGDVDRPAPAGCVTPGRDDSCCLTVRHEEGQGTGIFHRDVWPPELFQYVLSHEIGHYMGLCHYGHDAFCYNMWSMAYVKSRWEKDGVQAFLDSGVAHFYLAHEPYFTFRDAQNCWRYILDQMRPCVAGPDRRPTAVEGDDR